MVIFTLLLTPEEHITAVQTFYLFVTWKFCPTLNSVKKYSINLLEDTLKVLLWFWLSYHQNQLGQGWQPICSYLCHQGYHHCHHHGHRHHLFHPCHGQLDWHWAHRGSYQDYFDGHLHLCPGCCHTDHLCGQNQCLPKKGKK